MWKLFLGFALSFALGCTASDHEVERILTPMGYTEIRTHGHAFFACSEEDLFATKFTAKAPNGDRVKGAVCCGAFKNCTVRW